MLLPKKKILNDPIYGFISLEGGLIFSLIEHAYFQRLRRVQQLGLTHFVYPGAVHTRFQHAIGAMHLMSLAIDIIRSKGHAISEAEAEASKIAILLHDIGHGPFSHSLEKNIISDISHEELSLFFMEVLNQEFNNNLDLAISIFCNKYHKKFLFQLISSQLDVDRLDYLRRDSFYTGVTEGIVASERIIKMLEVVDDNLVVESKGIYSVEKFLIARRLMYWQVYFHKTVIIAENLLISIFNRIKYLYYSGLYQSTNKYLEYFFTNKTYNNNNELILNFSKIDDYDIINEIKHSCYSTDKILSHLSNSFLNRHLPKIIISRESFSLDFLNDIKYKIISQYNLSEEDVKYYMYMGEISNHAYSNIDDRINILHQGKLIDIAEASDMLNINVLSKNVKKYYLCYPKNLIF